ncbi:hypothetical protein H4S08_002929 [Coemansia sp. RSA 1365]|nr:hypothetical protein H4S08_002929 [Coemansia sp. RSA 1365]
MSIQDQAESIMPVYFLGHGGPNLLDDNDYPPNQPIANGLARIGDEIKNLNPRGMVIITGHWEAGHDSLQINGKSSQPQPLIYDFYGFPSWLYKEEFPHKVDPKLTQEVAKLFVEHNIKIDVVDRGLDHGAWIVLKRAGLENAKFPIIQLSLYRNDSMEKHLELGKVLAPLRSQGIVIVGSGMAVHNLPDYFEAHRFPSNSLYPYVIPFDKEIDHAIITVPSNQRWKATKDLAHSSYLKKAHPTIEYLLPLHVVVGAAGPEASAKKMLEAYQVSVSWSCYKLH